MVTPQPGPAIEEVILPSNVQSFFDARIRARVQGFVRDWKYDIGARVKAGEVLATVEAPDLDQQLQQAKGRTGPRRGGARARKDHDPALVVASRLDGRLAAERRREERRIQREGRRDGGRARKCRPAQSVDGLSADHGAFCRGRHGAQCRYRRFGRARISKQELFSVADIHQVRIYVGVPQAFAAVIKIGMIAELKLAQFPTRLFTAKVLTTSNAIAEDSRSLLVQLLADNPEGLLLPGSYAEVHFKLPGRAGVRRIPAAAVFFQRNTLAVATVGAENRVTIKPITIVRDLGTTIEISSGPSLNDRMILNPPQSLSDGDEVRIAESQPSAKAGAEE